MSTLDVPSSASTSDHVLDDMVRSSLAGAHARFAQRHGRAVRYHPDFGVFCALDDPLDPAAWDDVEALLGPDEDLALPGVRQWPDRWRVRHGGEGVQLVATDEVDLRPDAEAVVLGPDDVPEILDLIARTQPGPFRTRTVELGTYFGIRRDGALVAMAGERLRPPGWIEISAVCTAPEYRGRGLAGRLVRAVAADIAARGDRPFVQALASNENAVRLYRSLGFAVRGTTYFQVLTRAPRD